jgi:hypothetical protein
VRKVVGRWGLADIGSAVHSGSVFPEFDKCQNTQRVAQSQILSLFGYIKLGRSSIDDTMMILTLEDEMRLFEKWWFLPRRKIDSPGLF